MLQVIKFTTITYIILFSAGAVYTYHNDKLTTIVEISESQEATNVLDVSYQDHKGANIITKNTKIHLNMDQYSEILTFNGKLDNQDISLNYYHFKLSNGKEITCLKSLNVGLNSYILNEITKGSVYKNQDNCINKENI